MQTRRLGASGLVVSRLGLGTMTWGRETGPEDAAECLRLFCEAGGSLVDTADRYVDGASEEILGSLIGDIVPRSEVLISTKAGRPSGFGERNTGSSRDHLLNALDGSLKRLGTDYVDLWQVHAPDLSVPFEETLGALEYAVTSGRARYVGLSNFTGWQLAAMATWQRAIPGRTPLVGNQVSYSLLERGIEREVIPACEKLGVGVLAWSPLARGVLTGKYRGAIPREDRGGGGALTWFVDSLRTERAEAILDALVTAAVGLDATPLSVALAWVRDRPTVSSVIVGARHADQLAESISAEGVLLPPAITLALDEVSMPPTGYPETYPPSLL
jgi:aryl-alcohol dehydrogenase-like predicted oxidoreductase